MEPKTLRVDFPNGRGETLSARLELPSGEPRAHAIFAHCFTCSKNIAAATRISRALARQGIAVLRFDFTGLGNSEGDFANTNFSSNVADLVAAADHMRSELGSAPDLLIGHSLGGAAVLAAAKNIPEVVALATIAAPSEPGHLEHLFSDEQRATIERDGRGKVRIAGREFEVGRELLHDLEREDFPDEIASLRRSLLVLHSPTDGVVGIEHARRIFEAAKHPKSFVSLDRADHLLSSKEDSEFVADLIASWAARYLPAEPADAPASTGAPQADEGEVVVREVDGFRQTIAAGKHVFAADEPVSVGGGDTGPTPYDLLLASLGACTSMTLRMYANHKGWPLEGVEVALRHEKIHAKDCAECESETGKVDRIERHLTVRGPLDEAQRARLVEIADRCPVHRTLEGEKEIVTVLEASPGA